MRGAPPFAGRWPDNDVQLSREDPTTLQKQLAKRGFKPSNFQGMIDFDLRDDICKVQEQFGMVPDGHPTPELLGRLTAQP